MRFLLTNKLSADVAPVLQELGHTSATLAEFNLPEAATPTQVVHICRARQYELVTASQDLVEALLPDSGRAEIFGRVIVFLQTPDDQAEAMGRLFARYKRLTSGRLYTVTASRVKVRQLPTGSPSA